MGFPQDAMEHKLNEAMAHGSLYENAAKSIAPEIFGHQDVPRKSEEKKRARMLKLLVTMAIGL